MRGLHCEDLDLVGHDFVTNLVKHVFSISPREKVNWIVWPDDEDVRVINNGPTEISHDTGHSAILR